MDWQNRNKNTKIYQDIKIYQFSLSTLRKWVKSIYV